MKISSTTLKTSAVLDRLAIGMTVLCGIHCLLMPVVVALLPIFASSVFAHKNFHLWMLLLVLPTTGISIFMGCRKHKDKWTGALSLTGLLIMIAVTAFEYLNHTSGSSCPGCARSATAPVPLSAWINMGSGALIATAHIRNFRLCRNAHCCH